VPACLPGGKAKKPISLPEPAGSQAGLQITSDAILLLAATGTDKQSEAWARATGPTSPPNARTVRVSSPNEGLGPRRGRHPRPLHAPAGLSWRISSLFHGARVGPVSADWHFLGNPPPSLRRALAPCHV